MNGFDLAAIAQQCEGAHRDKQGWRARCPIHNGKSDTSLHIWEESGALRIYCHAGCKTEDILEHLKIDRKRRSHEPAFIFSYHDENGNLIFQACRNPPKKFFQRRPDPNKPGKWINDLKGVKPQLYHLPEIVKARDAGITIYIAEGEKDVETLRHYGLIATCNPMGAKKWRSEYSASLKGARVVLLTDNDTPGQEHADLIITSLTGLVKSLVRIDFPELPPGGDVTDWLQTHTIDELKKLANDTKPKIEAPHLVIKSLSEIEREKIDWLWAPYIPLSKMTFLEGDPGNGKTYLALALAASLSQGYVLPDSEGFIDDERVEPMNSLYITAEDGLSDTIRPRAEDLGADLDRVKVVIGWSAGIELHPFNFQQANLLEEAIRDCEIKLVIIDPIDAFLGADVDMYRPNEVRPIMSQINSVAQATRSAIVFIRHWTKSPGGSARYRGLGSIAFTAAIRSQLVVGEALDDETKRIMAHAKSNVGPIGKSQVFSIQDGIFGWYGTSDIDANTLAQQQPNKRKHQTRSAADWLKDTLRNGPISSKTLFDIAEASGIKERTLNRAKQALGILSEKIDGVWYWRIPKSYEDNPPF